MNNKRTDQVLAALRGTEPPTVIPAPTVADAARRRDDQIRFTFDVARGQHRFIRQFVLDSQTTASAATRALWSLVEDDSALAERLRGQLATRYPEVS